MIAAVLLELAQVARVGLHRIVAQPALDPQAVEMAFDDVIPALRHPHRAIRAQRRPGAEISFQAAPLSAGTSSSRSTSTARNCRIASSSTIFPPLTSLT